MIEIGKQALDNMNYIKVLNEERDTIQEDTTKERRRLLYDVYEPVIREIEHARDIAVDKLKKEEDALVAGKDTEVKELYVVVARVKQILDYLRLDTGKKLTILADDIRVRVGYYGEAPNKEDLGYFLDDTYLKVKLFIVQNNKPVNKYSLVALGKCLFPEYLLTLPYDYGLSLYTNHHYELNITIKDCPTVEQLKEWVNSHKAKLNLVGEYEKVKEEYQNTLQNYKVADFQDFIMVECPCGKYYYTEFERDYYSLIIRKNELRCPRCNALLEVGEAK